MVVHARRFPRRIRLLLHCRQQWLRARDGIPGMNWQSSACIGALGAVLVTAVSNGGWMPGKGGSWPLVPAIGMVVGVSVGLCMRLVPQESWRKEK